jgi:RNA polymerase sigma factor (sigma-70 family)
MCVSIDEMGGLAANEATRFEQAQAGCPMCLNALMARHEGLVQAVVRRQVLGGLPFAEALQAARLGLWRAILGYDPARGLAFSTYAWPCMMHQVWQAVKSHDRREAALPRSCQEPSDEAPDLAPIGGAALVQQALHTLVRRLPARLQFVVIARYGLDGWPPRSWRQIGAALGVCGERARQLHTEALVWLRHPAHSQTLRSLLDRHTHADYQFAAALAQRWLRQRGGRRGR